LELCPLSAAVKETSQFKNIAPEGIAQKSDGPNVPRSRSIHSASEAEARDELARSVVAKFTSRILEGLVVCRGLVERRKGIG
jgi:hypothetical protein